MYVPFVERLFHSWKIVNNIWKLSETTPIYSYYRKNSQVFVLWQEFHSVPTTTIASATSYFREVVLLYSVYSMLQTFKSPSQAHEDISQVVAVSNISFSVAPKSTISSSVVDLVESVVFDASKIILKNLFVYFILCNKSKIYLNNTWCYLLIY